MKRKNMEIPSLKQMLNAGVHFGHQTLRWNPKMSKYILTERNGIHIIDLTKTQECLKLAVEGIIKVLESGSKVLFVGTKKSVKEHVRDEAERCKSFFVTERWLGGMLTNFTTVKNSIKTLDDIDKGEAEGLFNQLKKKEVGALKKKRKKLEAVLGGIREMNLLPGLVFVIDTKNEHIAVKEARRLKIPVVAIVDTNTNPDDITYPIPGNDDAIKSVSLIVATIANAILEFSSSRAEGEMNDSKEPETTESATKSETQEESVNMEQLSGEPESGPEPEIQTEKDENKSGEQDIHTEKDESEPDKAENLDQKK
jgi:small subunit ribosomal protein S2